MLPNRFSRISDHSVLQIFEEFASTHVVMGTRLCKRLYHLLREVNQVQLRHNGQYVDRFLTRFTSNVTLKTSYPSRLSGIVAQAVEAKWTALVGLIIEDKGVCPFSLLEVVVPAFSSSLTSLQCWVPDEASAKLGNFIRLLSNLRSLSLLFSEYGAEMDPLRKVGFWEDVLHSCQGLQSLELSGFVLPKDEAEYIVDAMSTMTDLRVLNVPNLGWHDACLSMISPGFRFLNQLHTLGLSGAYPWYDASLLVGHIHGLCSLTALDLSDNDLRREHVIPIVAGLTKLHTLNLQHNMIGHDQNDHFWEMLRRVTTLNTLDLSSNEIGDLTGFGEAPNLRTLNVAFNDIRRVGWLAKLTGLQSLNLGGNEQIRQVPPEVPAAMTNLTKLYLNDMSICTKKALTIASVLSSLQKLEIFDVQYNPFLFSGLLAIVQSLKTLPCFRSLSYYNDWDTCVHSLSYLKDWDTCVAKEKLAKKYSFFKI